MENINSRVLNKATVLVFLVGIVVGFGSASLWLRRSNTVGAGGEAASAVSENMPTDGLDEAAEKSADLSLAEISAALSGEKNSVSVADQPAGDAVAVTVKVEGDAWVAVHEDTGGKPGNILGARLVTKDVSTGQIELLRRLMAGRKYYAMLHADDGDRVFDHTKDMPFMSSAGGAIADDFLATDALEAQ